jgi:hypothetical protein
VIDPSELTDKDLMDSLCEIEDGLSEWEVERVDEWAKVLDKGGILSRGQRAKAEEIFREKA